MQSQAAAEAPTTATVPDVRGIQTLKRLVFYVSERSESEKRIDGYRADIKKTRGENPRANELSEAAKKAKTLRESLAKMETPEDFDVQTYFDLRGVQATISEIQDEMSEATQPLRDKISQENKNVKAFRAHIDEGLADIFVKKFAGIV